MPVAQHRDLRLAGGAAGEQQHGDVAVGARAARASRFAGSTQAASKALRVATVTPGTPATRPTMSSSTMAIDGAVRASSRRRSASGSR